MVTTTRPCDHTPTYVGTWEKHRRKYGEWGRIIGMAHAYHDLYHEIGDISIETVEHIIACYLAGTLQWEADMPNPIDVWQETYEDEMPKEYALQWEVRTWAREYYKAYENEVFRLVSERRRTHYNETDVGGEG